MARAKIIQASFLIIVLAISMISNAVQTDVSGKWEMTANTNYEFDLDLRQGGDQISGTMTRTNGYEPVDSIQGMVSSDGKITFKRERPGEWVQDYTGQISSSGDSLSMDGTFAHNMAGSFPWTATRTQIPTTGIDSEKQPLNVKLAVSEKTTDVDVIEIEAEVSGDYESPLSYAWYKDNIELEGETGYKIRLESGVLPGEYLIKVQVTDDEGRTGEAWTTLNIVEGDTGIRGDVLEANLFDPIPNAIVSATSLKSGDTKTVKVSPDGKYSIHLMPGNYMVSASAPGYLTESGTSGDDVKVLSPHDEPYCIDCYTTFNFRLVMEPANGGKPCGTPWTTVFPDLNLNPCNVTGGPTLPTGSYVIWVSPVEGLMGSEPQDWKSYGPYQFRAKHYYSVVVKGDYGNSRVVVTEDDPETSCYESMPMPGYAYTYYRDDVLSYRLSHYAMTICPVE